VESAELVCPINPVVEIVFSRWTTPILWALRHHGRLRFTELAGLLPEITPKVLTQRLRQLERDGLITRTYHAEIPPRVEYEISELGRSLSPVFAALVRWSDRHLPEVHTARHAYDNKA
jgi:DNA-binding HxlR family transcriptional regulator